MAVGHESEMPDADEADREDMQKETPKKLLNSKRHHAFLVVMSGIAPAKANQPVGQSDQSVIGNSDAVCVVAQVLKNVLWAAKWSFGIDDPLMAAALPE